MIKESNLWFSCVPTTTSRTPDATGFLVSDYRMETGVSPRLDDADDARSKHHQIWEALKQYKKLPYTFIYLFSFFLLADVGAESSTRRPPC
jgi:hypothetical protein